MVERLKEAGAVIVGKNNMDEFAMAPPRKTPPSARPATPAIQNASPEAPAAARPPASPRTSATPPSAQTPAAPSASPQPYAAAWASNPPTGAYPGYGVIAYGSSLDQVGPLTRTVEDAALVLSVIAGARQARLHVFAAPRGRLRRFFPFRP